MKKKLKTVRFSIKRASGKYGKPCFNARKAQGWGYYVDLGTLVDVIALDAERKDDIGHMYMGLLIEGASIVVVDDYL